MSTSRLNKAARIISTLFVPPSFTIIIFTFLAFHLETESLKIAITLSVSYLFGFTAPIIMFFYLRSRGLISDSDASLKDQRTLPFSVAILFYLTGLILFIHFQVHIISIAFWFCYISNTFITILINRKWKISAHAMGAAGPFALLVYVAGVNALGFIVILLAVGWARIRLRCHTPAQVAAGTVLAFVSTYLQLVLIVRYFS